MNIELDTRAKVIDFRARPNTMEFLKSYRGEQYAAMWKRWGQAEPKPEPLGSFVHALDRAGISAAVFTGRQRKVAGVLVRGVTNDYIAECVRAYPERIIGIASVDQTAGLDAIREIDRAVRVLGLRGLSLDFHTPRIPIDDPLSYCAYGKAAELGIPVLLTMGPLTGRYAVPSAVDRVAEAFPELTIVCSHGCWPQVTEFVALAYNHSNVFLEASIYEFLPGAEPFIEAARTFLQDRVIYASAFPFNPLDTVDRFRALGFDPAVERKLLYTNAARVLGKL